MYAVLFNYNGREKESIQTVSKRASARVSEKEKGGTRGDGEKETERMCVCVYEGVQPRKGGREKEG